MRIRHGAVALAAVAAVGALPLARAAGGELDPTFARGGKVVTDFGASDHLTAIAVHRDGRIVAAGVTIAPSHEADLALARYNADGTLDPTFGGDGTVTTNLGGHDWADDVAIQRDGKIVVAGAARGRSVLVRYAADGRLDASFGSGGIVTAGIGAFKRVLLQPNGKLVAVGFVPRTVVARFEVDGTLDSDFGRDGMVFGEAGRADPRPSIPLRPGDAALAPDGKIVVAATRLDPRKRRNGDGLPVDLLVARYRADGARDRRFGRDGIASFDLRRTNCCYAEAVAVRRGGSVVVAGYGERSGPGLTRLRPDGRRDFRFGRRDAQTVLVGTWSAGVGGLALDARGRIVLALRIVTPPRSDPARPPAYGDWGVTRITPRGETDKRFAEAGHVTTDFGKQEDASALALQPDGKIVVGGYSGGRLLDASEPNDFALARYLVPPCVVPDVRRASVRVAAAVLELAGCRLGSIRRVSSRVRAQLIVGQSAPPGTRLPEDTRVSITVSRGRR